MKKAELNEKDSDKSTLSEKKGAEPLTRDEVLRLSSTTIRQLHHRVSGAVRFKEQNSDSAKLAFVRALTQTLQVYASILKDHELTELEARISELEKVKEQRQRS